MEHGFGTLGWEKPAFYLKTAAQKRSLLAVG